MWRLCEQNWNQKFRSFHKAYGNSPILGQRIQSSPVPPRQGPIILIILNLPQKYVDTTVRRHSISGRGVATIFSSPSRDDCRAKISLSKFMEYVGSHD